MIRLELFGSILVALKNGRFASLAENHPKDHRVIWLRFGLDDLNAGVYRTLEEVGEIMNLTRERVRQLEERGLTKLGLSEDV